MKRFILIALMATLSFACSKGSKYTINGTVIPAFDGKVVLFEFADGQPVAADTVEVVGGKFKLKGDITLPDIRMIGYEDRQQYIAQFFLEAGTIDLTIYPDSVQANLVVGSKTHDLFVQYQDEQASSQTKVNELQQRFQQAQMMGNEAEIEAIRFEYEAIFSNSNLYARNFIAKNNTSPVAAYVYLMHFFQEAPVAELDSMLTVFDQTIKGSQFVEVIRDHAESIRATSIGAVAPDFTLNDPNGIPVSLSSLRGKYVLVDFWASWCQPCIVEMPNILEQYAKYKDKGFEIFGVSLDREREPWIEAIGRFNMEWIHGWDLEDGQGKVANLYGVQGIPYMMLLDKEGKIIATNIRGEALAAKLAELMGE